jgi:hypothetical protein
MKEIVADKGYISKDNLQTAVDDGAVPYIPFKSNTTGKGSELWKSCFTITVSSARNS